MPDRWWGGASGPALGLAVGFCLLAGPLAGADAPREVGPEEFRRDLVGKVWKVELPDGDSATERVNADGTATISGAIEDSGTWRLSDTGFCTTWTRMRTATSAASPSTAARAACTASTSRTASR